MLTPSQSIVKRIFDLTVAVLGLLACGWIILIVWILVTIDSRGNGFYLQKRIGRYGKVFTLFKIKTMKNVAGVNTTVTGENDVRITRLGSILRKTKIDELPQLFNVLLGQMSIVGPRPDVPGYADKLLGPDRIILTVRPGITGPATLRFKDEEKILSRQKDPEKYNDDVIWPEKVQINRKYVENYSLLGDLSYLWKTVFGYHDGI